VERPGGTDETTVRPQDATAPPPRGRIATLVRGNSAVAASVMIMNVAAYGFQMISARFLGPEQYGGVASLMAMLMVISVAQLGLQAVGARRVAADPSQVEHIEATILRATYRVATGLGLLLLLLAPVVWHVLRLDSIVPAVLMALCAIPLAIQGGQLGILQGERRWLPLGLCFLSMGVSRLVAGTALIAWRPTEGAAMVGVLIGLCVPVVVAWAVLRRGRAGDRTAHSGEHDLRSVLRETAVSSQALLAFFVLSNLDIVVARNVLDDRQAGLYASGLILTKVVLFLPQFVVVIAFPSMSTPEARKRATLGSLGAIALCGVVSTLGAWLLSGVAMVFVGGDEYAAVEPRLWLFAVLGTLLAGLQMLTYSVLATRNRTSGLLIWAAAGVLLVGALLSSSLDRLVLSVIAVDSVIFVVLLASSLRSLRQDDAPVPAS
jgi:O-antigen/teichoic acid export membrane protein